MLLDGPENAFYRQLLRISDGKDYGSFFFFNKTTWTENYAPEFRLGNTSFAPEKEEVFLNSVPIGEQTKDMVSGRLTIVNPSQKSQADKAEVIISAPGGSGGGGGGGTVIAPVSTKPAAETAIDTGSAPATVGVAQSAVAAASSTLDNLKATFEKLSERQEQIVRYLESVNDPESEKAKRVKEALDLLSAKIADVKARLAQLPAEPERAEVLKVKAAILQVEADIGGILDSI